MPFLEAGNEVVISWPAGKRLLEVQQQHPELQIKVCDVARETDRQSLVAWVTANYRCQFFDELHLYTLHKWSSSLMDITTVCIKYKTLSEALRISFVDSVKDLT